MFVKLALRNVKRQMGNYLIYFITVALTISMMFALCNLIFSKELLDYVKRIEDLKGGLIGLAVFVSLIVAMVLGYATSFMLKLRKREFGTYLTLGMKRKDILLLFTIENLIICVVALIIGIFLGLVIYQGMIGLVAQLMEIQISLASYSMTGLIMTITLTIGVFVLSAITSSVYLRKVSIYELIHSKKAVNKGTKHPNLWLGVTLVSLIIMIGSCYGFYESIKKMFLSGGSDSKNMVELLFCLFLFSIMIVFFHIGLAKSVMLMLLKSNRIRRKGTNTFLMRQLSGQLNANAVMCGILAFLVTFAIAGTNVSFTKKATNEQFLNHNYPFDISATLTSKEDASNKDKDVKNIMEDTANTKEEDSNTEEKDSNTEEDSSYTKQEARKIIEKYARIKETIPYHIYTSGNGYLHSFTQWSGSGYDGLNDTFIKESDFNRLISRLGYDEISLKHEFLILAIASQTMASDFSNASLVVNQTTYQLKEVTDRYPVLTYGYFLTVVPDEVVSDMAIEAEREAIDLVEDYYDSQKLYDNLSYHYPSGLGYDIILCDYDIREYHRLEENSMTAILIVGMLYISIVFIFMAVAVLTLKLLSEISDDRQRYSLLHKLGTSSDEQSKTLFRQISMYFFAPYCLPLMLSVPIAFLCGRIIELAGYGALVQQIYFNSAMIGAVLTVIYVLYFTITYFIERRSILNR